MASADMDDTLSGGAVSLGPGELEHTIGYQLRLAQLASYRSFEGGLQSYGAAARNLGLLAIIGAHPGQPQSRLAEAISLGRSSLVAIIDRLEQEGLVRRELSVTDRRLKGVWLTPKGEEVVQDLIAQSKLHEEQLAQGLSRDERATLVRALRVVCANLASIGETVEP